MLTPFDYGNPLNVSERNLPHWEQLGTTYFVTFRLGDSIPIRIANKIKEERFLWLKNHTEPFSKKDWSEYNRLFSEKLQKLLDVGSGSCILKEPENSNLVRDTLLFFDGIKYKLGKWVIMPNHAHILVTPIADYSLKEITHSWKSFSAMEINKLIGKKGPVWQAESYDHIIRNVSQLCAIEDYIINNPSKAKLRTGFQLSSY